MMLTSIDDEKIVVNTDTQEINGSRIVKDWISDQVMLYEDTEENRKKLLEAGGYIDLMETEDGKLYSMDGARWDHVIDCTWIKNYKEA